MAENKILKLKKSDSTWFLIPDVDGKYLVVYKIGEIFKLSVEASIKLGERESKVPMAVPFNKHDNSLMIDDSNKICIKSPSEDTNKGAFYVLDLPANSVAGRRLLEIENADSFATEISEEQYQKLYNDKQIKNPVTTKKIEAKDVETALHPVDLSKLPPESVLSDKNAKENADGNLLLLQNDVQYFFLPCKSNDKQNFLQVMKKENNLYINLTIDDKVTTCKIENVATDNKEIEGKSQNVLRLTVIGKVGENVERFSTQLPVQTSDTNVLTDLQNLLSGKEIATSPVETLPKTTTPTINEKLDETLDEQINLKMDISKKKKLELFGDISIDDKMVGQEKQIEIKDASNHVRGTQRFRVIEDYDSSILATVSSKVDDKEKTFAQFKQNGEEIDLFLEKEFFENFQKANPSVNFNAQIVDGQYVIKNVNLLLNETAQINTAQLQGTNKDVAVIFSALGFIAKDKENHIGKIAGKGIFDVSITKNFLEKALSPEKENAKIADPFRAISLVATLEIERKNAKDKQNQIVSTKIGNVEMFSVPIKNADGKIEFHSYKLENNMMSYYVQTQVLGKDGRSSSVPAFVPAQLSLRQNKEGNYELWGEIPKDKEGNGKHLKIANVDLSDENTKNNLKILTENRAFKDVKSETSMKEENGFHILPSLSDTNITTVGGRFEGTGAISITEDIKTTPKTYEEPPEIADPTLEKTEEIVEDVENVEDVKEKIEEEHSPDEDIKTEETVETENDKKDEKKEFVPKYKLKDKDNKISGLYWGVTTICLVLSCIMPIPFAILTIIAGVAATAYQTELVNNIKKLLNERDKKEFECSQCNKEKQTFREKLRNKQIEKFKTKNKFNDISIQSLQSEKDGILADPYMSHAQKQKEIKKIDKKICKMYKNTEINEQKITLRQIMNEIGEKHEILQNKRADNVLLTEVEIKNVQDKIKTKVEAEKNINALLSDKFKGKDLDKIDESTLSPEELAILKRLKKLAKKFGITSKSSEEDFDLFIENLKTDQNTKAEIADSYKNEIDNIQNERINEINNLKYDIENLNKEIEAIKHPPKKPKESAKNAKNDGKLEKFTLAETPKTSSDTHTDTKNTSATITKTSDFTK